MQTWFNEITLLPLESLLFTMNNRMDEMDRLFFK